MMMLMVLERSGYQWSVGINALDTLQGPGATGVLRWILNLVPIPLHAFLVPDRRFAE